MTIDFFEEKLSVIELDITSVLKWLNNVEVSAQNNIHEIIEKYLSTCINPLEKRMFARNVNSILQEIKTKQFQQIPTTSLAQVTYSDKNKRTGQFFTHFSTKDTALSSSKIVSALAVDTVVDYRETKLSLNDEESIYIQSARFPQWYGTG